MIDLHMHPQLSVDHNPNRPSFFCTAADTFSYPKSFGREGALWHAAKARRGALVRHWPSPGSQPPAL
jgi:hypothetical protein